MKLSLQSRVLRHWFLATEASHSRPGSRSVEFCSTAFICRWVFHGLRHTPPPATCLLARQSSPRGIEGFVFAACRCQKAPNVRAMGHITKLESGLGQRAVTQNKELTNKQDNLRLLLCVEPSCLTRWASRVLSGTNLAQVRTLATILSLFHNPWLEIKLEGQIQLLLRNSVPVDCVCLESN